MVEGGCFPLIMTGIVAQPEPRNLVFLYAGVY